MYKNKRYSLFRRPAPTDLETRAVRRGSDDLVGQTPIGKARALCAIVTNEVEHGALDEAPCSILFFDFQLAEADGCKLRTVTFELKVQPDPDLGLREEEWPVVTEHVYPRMLQGHPTTRVWDRRTRIGLNLVGPEGMGLELPETESQKQKERTRRWLFEGNRCSDEDSSYFRRARWMWTTDTLNDEHRRIPNFYGAMVVRQSLQSLVFTCKVHGKLKERRGRIFPVSGHAPAKTLRLQWSTGTSADFAERVATLRKRVIDKNRTEWTTEAIEVIEPETETMQELENTETSAQQAAPQDTSQRPQHRKQAAADPAAPLWESLDPLLEEMLHSPWN